MPRTRTDTRQEIREVAVELFASQGFEKTSLREVAERLGITKAALYYHFRSKSELLQGILLPMIEEVDGVLRDGETNGVTQRDLLAGYFDVIVRHREVFWMIFRDLGTLAHLDLVDRILNWRTRLTTLLIGEGASVEQVARATVAVGGLQDCLINEGPVDAFRAAALEAAYAALGPDRRPSGDQGA